MEQYLDNHVAARAGAGLGSRNVPPFLAAHLVDWPASASTSAPAPASAIDQATLQGLGQGLGLGLLDAGAEQCGMCLCPLEREEAVALQCRHWYCSSCWDGYCASRVSSGSLFIPCPRAAPSLSLGADAGPGPGAGAGAGAAAGAGSGVGCGMVATLDLLVHVSSPSTAQRAKALLLRLFVEQQSASSQCTSAYCKNPRGCPGIVFLLQAGSGGGEPSVQQLPGTEAACSLCGFEFCVACDLLPHAPASCSLVARWEQRGGFVDTGREEEAEARRLKHLTTRPCPRCGVRIEKNGGCPHMTCVQPNCRYQFCWDCLGEYHTSTSCSRPRIQVDNGSALAFDDCDKQCTHFFLLRSLCLRRQEDCLAAMDPPPAPASAPAPSSSSRAGAGATGAAGAEDSSTRAALLSLAQAWEALARAHSALAHANMLLFFQPSAKASFLALQLQAEAAQLMRRLEERGVCAPSSAPASSAAPMGSSSSSSSAGGTTSTLGPFFAPAHSASASASFSASAGAGASDGRFQTLTQELRGPVRHLRRHLGVFLPRVQAELLPPRDRDRDRERGGRDRSGGAGGGWSSPGARGAGSPLGRASPSTTNLRRRSSSSSSLPPPAASPSHPQAQGQGQGQGGGALSRELAAWLAGLERVVDVEVFGELPPGLHSG